MAADDQLWKVCAPKLNGRPVKFKDPHELYLKAVDYFAWVDAHPWQDRAASTGKYENGDRESKSQSQHVKALRKPYTLYGFCAYAGIASKWADFKRNYLNRKGFLEVLLWIENVVATEQVEGAMIHRYDGNLVARLNNIADSVRNEITGKDGKDIFASLSTEELRAKLDELNKKLS